MEILALNNNHYDVAVVGARCAGAAAAMLLARAGVRVLLIDRQSYGSDSLSTHALMRPAVIQLDRWGLLDSVIASGAPVIPATTFYYGEEKIRIDIRKEPGIPGLVAPRRMILDRILVDSARKAGANVLHDVIAESLIRDDTGRVTGLNLRDRKGNRATINCDIVLGADGLGSTIARQAGAEIIARQRYAVASVFTYARNHGATGYHWYYLPRAAAGIIPTNNDEACLCISVPMERYDTEIRHDPASGFRTVLREAAPDLADHLCRTTFAPFRAFRGVAGFLRQAYGPGWILAGDAGFFRDPLTAHGISDAFRSAECAARAIMGGTVRDFSLYQQSRDEFALPMMEVTDAICSFDWNFDQLRKHHKRLSEIMKLEAAVPGIGMPLPIAAPPHVQPLARTFRLN
jgi:flavin-dependent dehydrogenase